MAIPYPVCRSELHTMARPRLQGETHSVRAMRLCCPVRIVAATPEVDRSNLNKISISSKRRTPLQEDRIPGFRTSELHGMRPDDPSHGHFNSRYTSTVPRTKLLGHPCPVQVSLSPIIGSVYIMGEKAAQDPTENILSLVRSPPPPSMRDDEQMVPKPSSIAIVRYQSPCTQMGTLGELPNRPLLLRLRSPTTHHTFNLQL